MYLFLMFEIDSLPEHVYEAGESRLQLVDICSSGCCPKVVSSCNNCTLPWIHDCIRLHLPHQDYLQKCIAMANTYLQRQLLLPCWQLVELCAILQAGAGAEPSPVDHWLHVLWLRSYQPIISSCSKHFSLPQLAGCK